MLCSFLLGQSPSLGLCPLLLSYYGGRCLPDASLCADTPPRCGWGVYDGSLFLSPFFPFFFFLSPTFLWSPGCSQPALTLPGFHFLCSLLSHCLSACLPSLMLLDTQLCLLPGAILPLRRSFPTSHLSSPNQITLFLAIISYPNSHHLSKLPLPKFSCHCWTWFCILLCSTKKPLHPPTAFASSVSGGQFCSFSVLFWFDFFHTMGHGFWALPPFQINTNNKYCCSPSQGHCQPCNTFDPPFIISGFPPLSLWDMFPVFSKCLISCEFK